MKIDNSLKSVRKASGYTQVQIAEFLGLNSSNYEDYEEVMSIIPLEVLERVSKLFGIDMSILLGTEAGNIKSSILCNFRDKELTADDMKQVADFNDVAMSYLKMVNLLESR